MTIVQLTTDYKDHHVLLEDIIAIPSEIADPLMVFKGSVPNSFVLLTGIEDKADRAVIIAIHFDRPQDRFRVNRIASIYGKDDIEQYIKNHINDYIDGDKKRSDIWITRGRLQLPALVQSNNVTSSASLAPEQNNATPKQQKSAISQNKGGGKSLDVDSANTGVTNVTIVQQ
ncbi:hypothetical protein SAMN02910384_02655 [Pseudobutyrivibrio sp. ACV-2]|nr:hypothetical protein SAMN02910384_02655 [Pseudobutyrivibrio sp. ACV-2]